MWYHVVWCGGHHYLITLWQGHDFCITGTLCGKSTGYWWMVDSLYKGQSVSNALYGLDCTRVLGLKQSQVNVFVVAIGFPDSKVHGANMGLVWGRQDPGGPHVGPMNFATWVCILSKGSFQALCFHHNSDLIEMSFCSHPSYSEVIIMTFWMWHDSTVVVSSAKFIAIWYPTME